MSELNASSGFACDLPVGERGQINISQVVFPLQVRPEVILSRPILHLFLALTQVAAEYDLVALKLSMHASLVSVEVIPGTESVGSPWTVRNIALVRLLVPRQVFS